MERHAGAGRAAAARRQESAAAVAAVPRRRPAHGRVPACRRPASSIAPATWSCPIIRSFSKPCTIACTKRWTSTAGCELLRRNRSRPASNSSPATRASRRRSAISLLNANPYAFLDDAPLEERRARAVSARRTIRADDVRDLGRLDPDAIAQVRSEAWPLVRDAEELHDTLLTVGALPEADGRRLDQFLRGIGGGRSGGVVARRTDRCCGLPPSVAGAARVLGVSQSRHPLNCRRRLIAK